MKWLIIRHAEKASDLGGNPGLSARGLEQADQLAKALRHGMKSPRLCASPKRRAQETMRPLATSLGEELRIENGLDERQSAESFQQFRERLQRFLSDLDGSTGAGDEIVLCSHLDWLEEFRTLLPCEDDLLSPRFDSWGTAQVMTLERGSASDPWKVLDFRRY